MTECYACAKLAELRAENSALRGIASELREDVAERDDVITVLKRENAEMARRAALLSAALERETLEACNTCAERVDMQEKLEKIREIAS